MFQVFSQSRGRHSAVRQTWLIRAQAGIGQSLGENRLGPEYYLGPRILRNTRTKFLGSTLLIGGEYLMINALRSTESANVLETNASHMAFSFVAEAIIKSINLGVGAGYYWGIQQHLHSGPGASAHIAWAPIRKWEQLHPFIGLRTDLGIGDIQVYRVALNVGITL